MAYGVIIIVLCHHLMHYKDETQVPVAILTIKFYIPVIDW